MQLRTRLAVLLLIGVGACSSSGTQSHTYVGRVTKVGPHVACIGAPAASGRCFVRDRVTRRLVPDQCVRVTYSASRDETGPFHALRIEGVAKEASKPCEGTTGS